MRSFVLLLVLSTLSCCASSGSDPDGSDPPLVLGDGAEISGSVVVDEFRIEAGETVYVVGDLSLSSRGPVWIEGDLIAKDADDLGLVHAPRIAIQTSSSMTILGRILGGKGRSFEGQDPESTKLLVGGDGSSIWLRSPDLASAGFVRGGAGGQGGGSARGGHGGDIDVEMESGFLTTRGLTSEEFAALQARYEVGWLSGAGGRGGKPAPSIRNGGDGGGSGGVTFSNYTPED